MPKYDKPEDAENGLQTLLLRATPENANGNKTMRELSRIMHISRWGIHKWVQNEKLSPERASQIVEISRITGWDEDGEPIRADEPRVKLEELHQYVYKD
jgi:hypothetical protein